MSVWDNRFWDIVDTWKRGLMAAGVLAGIVALGGGVVLVIFGLLIVLPAELFFGNTDLVDYSQIVFILGCATYRLYLVSAGDYVLYTALKKDGEQPPATGDKHGDNE